MLLLLLFCLLGCCFGGGGGGGCWCGLGKKIRGARGEGVDVDQSALSHINFHLCAK